MNSIFKCGALWICVLLIVSSGCELVTEDAPKKPQQSAATHLVINEVFTLPFTHPSSYTWIEFYNPANNAIDLSKWTLSYTTQRVVVTTLSLEDSLHRIGFTTSTTQPDSFGAFDVPLAESRFILFPGELMTIVNNEARLLDHTNWGPGPSSTRFERQFVLGPVESADTTFFSPDTIFIVKVQKGYGFFFPDSGQLVLRDSTGAIMDVVRFGNYTYTGPVTDPLLGSGNKTVGVVPQFQSVCRYAGAYFTGNSANDFYISDIYTPPSPHWYNTLGH